MIYIVASVGAPYDESHRWLTTDRDIKFKRCELRLPEEATDLTVLHEHYTRKYQWTGVCVEPFDPVNAQTSEYRELEDIIDSGKRWRDLFERLIKHGREIDVSEIGSLRQAV